MRHNVARNHKRRGVRNRVVSAATEVARNRACSSRHRGRVVVANERTYKGRGHVGGLRCGARCGNDRAVEDHFSGGRV